MEVGNTKERNQQGLSKGNFQKRKKQKWNRLQKEGEQKSREKGLSEPPTKKTEKRRKGHMREEDVDRNTKKQKKNCYQKNIASKCGEQHTGK